MRFILLSAAVLLSNLVFGQRQVASFEDGTEVEYEVLSDDAADMRPLWLSWGATLQGSIHGLGLDMWIPEKAKIECSTSIVGTAILGPQEDSLFVGGTPPASRPWRLRGHYILKSNSKTKERRISLKSVATGSNERTVYVTTYDMPRTTYVCLHGGFGYQNIPGQGVKYGEIALGASLMRARHLDLQLNTGGKRGAQQQRGISFMELYADLLFFTGPSVYDQSIFDDMSTDERNGSNIGLEVAWRGMTTLGRGAGFGTYGKLGFGVGPYEPYVIYGFGIMMGLKK